VAKSEKKKKRYNYQMQKANNTHVTMLVVVGGYVLYMAYRMVKNTLSGESSMSMTTTVILAVVMGLVGLAVLAYSGYVFYLVRKKSELTEEEAKELDEQMAQADLENYGYVVGEEETSEPTQEAENEQQNAEKEC
jgi:flagellar basal body-associated protein FliL